MNKVYNRPEITVIEVEITNMVAQSIANNIYDSDTGGDDGEGGYDPSSSLSRENGGSEDLWNSRW